MSHSYVERFVSAKSLGEMLLNQLRAISLCLDNSLPMAALILMYVMMDNMAALDRAPDHESTKRSDFVQWVERYVIPESGLPCSATDLYAARCGLVHAHSSESNLSRQKKATPILYAWGPAASEQELQTLIHAHCGQQCVDHVPLAIHVDRVCAALRQGVARFIREVKNDRSRQDLVLARASVIFSNLPADEL